MLTDSGKGITTPITYNILNLPGTVTLPGGTIQNHFFADGTKYRTQNEQGDRLYHAGYEFVDGELDNYNFGDGRLAFEG